MLLLSVEILVQVVLSYPVARYLFILLLFVLKMPSKLIPGTWSSLVLVVEYGLEGGKNPSHRIGIVAERTFDFILTLISVHKVVETEVLELKVKDLSVIKLVTKPPRAAYAPFPQFEKQLSALVACDFNITEVTVLLENFPCVRFCKLGDQNCLCPCCNSPCNCRIHIRITAP